MTLGHWMLLSWAVSGFVVSGIVFANCVRQYPASDGDHRSEFGCAFLVGALLGVAGPLGVLIAWLYAGCGKDGWMLPRMWAR